jgi:hypothetical protein
MNALVTDLQSKYADNKLRISIHKVDGIIELFERAVPDLREPLPVPSVRDQDIGSVAVLGVEPGRNERAGDRSAEQIRR